MKAYLITTGGLFSLVTVLHLWRMLSAEPHLAKDPWYWLITLAAAALGAWAWLLLRRSSRA
jgi:hypothetical protein